MNLSSVQKMMPSMLEVSKGRKGRDYYISDNKVKIVLDAIKLKSPVFVSELIDMVDMGHATVRTAINHLKSKGKITSSTGHNTRKTIISLV